MILDFCYFDLFVHVTCFFCYKVVLSSSGVTIWTGGYTDHCRRLKVSDDVECELWCHFLLIWLNGYGFSLAKESP